MKAIAKFGTAVVAGTFALVLAGGTAQAATPPLAPAATSSAAGAMSSPPTPNIKWLCNKPIVRKFIPQCSRGRGWTPEGLRKARCVLGHGPFVGWTGMPKLTWWLHKCYEKDEWKKW
ncbi:MULTISPECIES: hypothetical protein [unclassified Nonomuraea]|uniref:hypothetical protein n=1 Tax=unclassified Nonomuraea TaxID=2593643 RepID=UPI0033CC56FF